MWLHSLTKCTIEMIIAVLLSKATTEVGCRAFRNDSKELLSPPVVFLTVSSIVLYNGENITERQLELNWFNDPKSYYGNQNSWVGLFDHDPIENITNALAKALTSMHSDGYYKTSINFPRINFSISNLNDECLGYWIGYVYEDELISKSCIRAHPHWMYGLRDIIGRKTLRELMIPGTHDSGSYKYYDPKEYTRVIRYQMTQEESIWNQLVYGIRYFDLRVVYADVRYSKEKFWITHGVLRTNHTLKDIFDQIRTFLDHTNEIVIMDIHDFYEGYRDIQQRYKQFEDMLISSLGMYIMPDSFNQNTTLNKLWITNKRLFVGFEDNLVNQNGTFYHKIHHLWGNKQSPEELQKYFNKTICEATKYNILWSAMVELTANTITLITDELKGLRQMAQSVNKHLTKWFINKWWHCTNIVATDFFLGNHLIELAIDVNTIKWGKS